MLKIENATKGICFPLKGKEITVYAFYFALFSLQERGPDNKKKSVWYPSLLQIHRFSLCVLHTKLLLSFIQIHSYSCNGA